jgi:hypothetical protein
LGTPTPIKEILWLTRIPANSYSISRGLKLKRQRLKLCASRFHPNTPLEHDVEADTDSIFFAEILLYLMLKPGIKYQEPTLLRCDPMFPGIMWCLCRHSRLEHQGLLPGI